MKKNMKRMMAMLITVAMFAGCGSKDKGTAPPAAEKSTESATDAEKPATGTTELAESVDPADITMWIHFNESWNASYDRMKNDYEALNPGSTISLQVYPYAEFEQKIQSALASGEAGPDIYEMWGGWIVDFSDKDVLSPVPDAFWAELKDDSYAPVMDGVAYNGKYYGLPFEYNIEMGGMLVNKNMFAEKGITEYPKTWDEMLAVGKEFVEMKGDVLEKRGFDFMSTDTLTHMYLMMILSQGGEYLDADGKFNFNTPEAEKAMQDIVDYVLVDHQTTTEALYDDTLANHFLVFQDVSAMAIRGPWVITISESQFGSVYGEDYDYIANPFYGPEKKFVAETGWAYAVSAKSSLQDAAWKFVEYMYQPDVMLEHNLACASLPARKSVVNDPDYLAQAPYMEALVGILENGQYIGPFNSDVLKDKMALVYTDMTSNGLSVKDGIARLTNEMNEFIGK